MEESNVTIFSNSSKPCFCYAGISLLQLKQLVIVMVCSSNELKLRISARKIIDVLFSIFKTVAVVGLPMPRKVRKKSALEFVLPSMAHHSHHLF